MGLAHRHNWIGQQDSQLELDEENICRAPPRVFDGSLIGIQQKQIEFSLTHNPGIIPIYMLDFTVPFLGD